MPDDRVQNAQRSRTEELREIIEEEIVTQQLAPGTRLDEVGLAKRFGVSRTPVREAIGQLASRGLLEIRPRRGAIVPHVSPATLIEMFEVMAEMEALSARLAARRMSAEERAALVTAHHHCGEADAAHDPDTYYYRNEHFHKLIYAGSHNRFLEQEATRLHRRLGPYRRLQLRVHNRMATSSEEHQAVVGGILDGDGEGAAVAIRNHVAVQGERFADMVASIEQLERRKVAR
jgi:DNA-binding GntR family transcriptional regulator